jgi:hypothetical protein
MRLHRRAFSVGNGYAQKDDTMDDTVFDTMDDTIFDDGADANASST